MPGFSTLADDDVTQSSSLTVEHSPRAPTTRLRVARVDHPADHSPGIIL
jgi:hypothetical protein